MIEGVSRPVYDGYTHQTELNQFLFKHGMQEFSTTAMPASILNYVKREVQTFGVKVNAITLT